MEIFLSAGDLSGDNASALLVPALRKRQPDLTLCGLGREKLKRLGQEQFADGRDLAVLGFWEVARRYPYFRRLMFDCVAEIEKRRPAAVVLVDYPGFNLRLAKRIKHLGIPIIYYISPQIWAWGHKRVKEVEELVDLMLLILPFERDFYADRQVDAQFVGHYLLEDIASEYIATSPPDLDRPQLALLPGSRPQEIERMLPSMLETARAFNIKYGGRAVIAGVEGAFDYKAALHSYGHDNVTVDYENSRRLVYESSLVLTASGTATLETGIIGRPMVVVYRTGALTYQIARRLIKLDKIALVNLVLNEKVVPELIQGQASPKQMLAALARFIDEPAFTERTVAALHRVPKLLGGEGASDRAADLILNRLGRA